MAMDVRNAPAPADVSRTYMLGWMLLVGKV